MSATQSTTPAADHSEGMSFLSTLPQRVVRVYMPLSLIVIVLTLTHTTRSTR